MIETEHPSPQPQCHTHLGRSGLHGLPAPLPKEQEVATRAAARLETLAQGHPQRKSPPPRGPSPDRAQGPCQQHPPVCFAGPSPWPLEERKEARTLEEGKDAWAQEEGKEARQSSSGDAAPTPAASGPGRGKGRPRHPSIRLHSATRHRHAPRSQPWQPTVCQEPRKGTRRASCRTKG